MMGQYRIVVMEVDTTRQGDTIRTSYTPTARFTTTTLTPWDAVIEWADLLKDQEAS